MNAQFESDIIELTRPLNGQYPRPWMTKLRDPTEAKVFVVGRNQAKGYDQGAVGSQSRHIDALFNRNDITCRGLYDEVTGGTPSPTRQNIDALVTLLEQDGVREILETNVVCYSTPMSDELRDNAHIGGAQRGEEIFRFLLARIQPRILIAHGAGTIKDLGKILGEPLPPAPQSTGSVAEKIINGLLFISIPSLAPPAYNKWSYWASEHLAKVSTRVAQFLR